MDSSFSNKSHHSRTTSRYHVPLRPQVPHSAHSNDPSHTMNSSTVRTIPADKLEEAVEIYSRYLAAVAEEALAERNSAHHLQPSNSQARSATSRRSSKYHQLDSGSTSEFDGMSDISSVVDFDGNKKPSKALSISYKGKVVKQTRRSPFSPVKKLKTHLIRHLGCCQECSTKKTPCPLSHQDIETLERMVKQRRNELRSQDANSSGSSTNSSQQTARSISGRHGNESAFSQDDLMHMGAGTQLPVYNGMLDTMQHDLQSPGGDLLSDLTPGIIITDFQFRQPELDHGTELYGDHAHGSIILIGVQQNDFVYCQHKAGCQKQFLDAESLQTHFQYDHFDFTRITPAIKHVCLNCAKENTAAYMRCKWCFVHNNIQSQIHGHFIRNLESSYHPGNGPAPLHNYSSTPFYPAYATSVNNAETGPSRGFGNPNQFGNNAHTNQYGGPSYQGYGNNQNNYDYTAMDGNQYQGNYYTNARQMAVSVRVLFVNVKRHGQRFKHLFLLASLLVIITLCFARNKIISETQLRFPQAGPKIRERLPTIGFIILFLSFGTSFLAKHRVRSNIHSQHSCTALRAFSPIASRFNATPPHTHGRCDEHL